MKSLLIGFVAVIVAVALFVIGLTANETLSFVVGLCAYTPAVLMLGWGLNSVLGGRRVTLTKTAAPAPPVNMPTNGRPVRRRQPDLFS